MDSPLLITYFALLETIGRYIIQQIFPRYMLFVLCAILMI